ncbi:tryptophan 7-halogenase [Psychrosphaera sp. 1_MG-2023]|uniref:tryptophan halogenase family protein n=1 Tax=Psychrosphaera sp. 1_MG-2023 TaxID=3062643 RepID=UPI0026E473B9|nr:tryptophan halogenase family protein [Psychrosphaera sp. 1_MG-2023]MDO6721387.1 tryptophan 7-halogenase [Psychrosphaera sp. 1_MG-2023]
MTQTIKRIVIAGGGTAGWMTAALLSKVLPKSVEITLVESEAIGIVGVGEATIPPIQTFNKFLGIDERAFLKETNGSIKLAIKFENWRVDGESYFHTFGSPGTSIGFSNFQHYWLRAKTQLGLEDSIWDYDLNYLCCQQNKFNKMNTQDPIYQIPYAYHFDSGLYGQFLRRYSEKNGVKRIEGIIKHVKQNADTDFVEGIQLADGTQIDGDFFVDCTGARGLLLQKTLGIKYQDWSHWLPADSAIAVATDQMEQIPPYTRSIAHKVGWQWQIPLTHRTGNGIVYSSSHLSDDDAMKTLTENVQGKTQTAPRKLTFRTGKVEKQWHKNVVAIGLSSGFLEPLESTSIYLIQSAVVRLAKMFSTQGITRSVTNAFNQESDTEIETIRDFVILHYYANERTDSDFWQDMRNLKLPERLSQKIQLFQDTGSMFNEQHDIFLDASWLQVMLGQGINPTSYHPSADSMSSEELLSILAKIKQAKMAPLPQMMTHDDFLTKYVG